MFNIKKERERYIYKIVNITIIIPLNSTKIISVSEMETYIVHLFASISPWHLKIYLFITIVESVLQQEKESK